MPSGELPKLRDGEVVKERWRIESALGTGAFGAVYKVEDTKEPGKHYAMKTEDRSAQAQILKMETAVLKKMGERNAQHICKMVGRGRTDSFNFIVMTLTSKSLQNVRKLCPRKVLSLNTALRVGAQCVRALEELHNGGYIHRDIKPGNFAVGRKESGEGRVVFVLDFGLARAYRNPDGTLRTPRESTGFRGTVRYAPLACHRKEELSRKDDLESWFYQVVELLVGQLPWHMSNDKVVVGHAKEAARRNGTLFAHTPREFKDLLDYVDGLHYVDDPDYNYLIALLDRVAKREGFSPNDPYDWETLPDVN